MTKVAWRGGRTVHVGVVDQTNIAKGYVMDKGVGNMVEVLGDFGGAILGTGGAILVTVAYVIEVILQAILLPVRLIEASLTPDD